MKDEVVVERSELIPAGDIQTLDQVRYLGEVFHQSGFFSDVTDASKAIVKILAGREIGLGAMASMTGILMIRGKPTLSANTMLAVLLRSGRYKHEVLKHTNTECQIRFLRRDDLERRWEEVGISSFTMEDAKAANLTMNETYRKYPRNMLFARAVSNGCKWFAPDVFCGVTPYTPEELLPSGENVSDERSL